MDNKVKISAAILSMLVAGAWTTAHADTDSPDINTVVTAVMNDQYGQKYDAQNSCWIYSHSSDQNKDTETYCMRIGQPEVVDTPSGKQLYLNAFSISGVDGYRYAHNVPGLMGAFRVQLNVKDAKGNWQYLAFNSDLEFGTVGDCGCQNARFVKLSNQGIYGWLFSSGGSWQAEVSTFNDLVALHKTDFIDISDIPEILPADQDTLYEVDVAEDQRKVGMFPLRVSKMKGASKPGKPQKVGTILVNFDPKSFTYSLPNAH
jgi:hypothetical protein